MSDGYVILTLVGLGTVLKTVMIPQAQYRKGHIDRMKKRAKDNGLTLHDTHLEGWCGDIAAEFELFGNVSPETAKDATEPDDKEK